MHYFCIKFSYIFGGRAPLPRSYPYPFVPYSQFLDPPLISGTKYKFCDTPLQGGVKSIFGDITCETLSAHTHAHSAGATQTDRRQQCRVQTIRTHCVSARDGINHCLGNCHASHRRILVQQAHSMQRHT